MEVNDTLLFNQLTWLVDFVNKIIKEWIDEDEKSILVLRKLKLFFFKTDIRLE